MRTTSDYLGLVTSWLSNKPRYTGTVAIITTAFAALQSFLDTLPTAFDLDYAVGPQLDACGVRIGLSRYVIDNGADVFFSWDTPGLGWDQGYWQGSYDPNVSASALDDATYRAALYAKVNSNTWDGTNDQVQNLVPSSLLPSGTTVAVIDNQNMTMTMLIRGAPVPPLVAALLEGGYIPLKPGGVALIYAFIPTQPSGPTPTLPFYLPTGVPA